MDVDATHRSPHPTYRTQPGAGGEIKGRQGRYLGRPGKGRGKVLYARYSREEARLVRVSPSFALSLPPSPLPPTSSCAGEPSRPGVRAVPVSPSSGVPRQDGQAMLSTRSTRCLSTTCPSGQVPKRPAGGPCSFGRREGLQHSPRLAGQGSMQRIIGLAEELSCMIPSDENKQRSHTGGSQGEFSQSAAEGLNPIYILDASLTHL